MSLSLRRYQLFIKEFLKALLRQWWALMSCAVFTFIGIWAAAGGKSNKWTVEISFGAAAILLLVAAYRAWKEEYIQNRDGPRVSLEWDSGQSWRQDLIRLRNIGKSSALAISIGEFSWSEIYWTNPIMVPSLHADGKDLAIQPEIAEKRRGEDHIGHLGHILRLAAYQNREPLSIDVTFSDANRTIFTQAFYLRIGPGRWTDPRVVVELGKLKVKRN